MRAWIALEFVGVVTAAVIYAVVVIVVTATVVFGLVGASFGDG